MLLLVVADNTLQMLVGWELVGLCSFMLIGHWWEEKPNSDAALKAFLTTRTGDIGLLIGVIMTFFIVQARDRARARSTSSRVNEAALSGKVEPHARAVVRGRAAVGDHRQVAVSSRCTPGCPTPWPARRRCPRSSTPPRWSSPASTSARASTRSSSQGFSIGNGGVNLMALIGGITVIIGAALAFVQDDIKKVLAYSTISQLGYMVMALGVGAWIAAIFHLFTHAFFKADLFLGAGSVSHSGSHHSFDMKKDMGGLRKYMPQTFWTFIIGIARARGHLPARRASGRRTRSS